MSTWILAIDTSTEACSCALGDGNMIVERYTDIPRKHAEKALPMVEEVLEEAAVTRQQLAAIAFGRGPGAFTGLRIAASVVQGLAFALDLPVIPVSSLQALAQRGLREYGQHRTVAAIDARMNEVYWGGYAMGDHDLMMPVTEEALCAPAEMSGDGIDSAAEWQGVGTGWQYQEAMPEPFRTMENVHDNVFVHARDVLTLARPKFEAGEYVAATEALPVYLRNNVVQR